MKQIPEIIPVGAFITYKVHKNKRHFTTSKKMTKAELFSSIHIEAYNIKVSVQEPFYDPD